MNTRLWKFLEAEGLTQAQFADRINVARAGISHIIAGRNKPGYDFIINTMHAFPGLNIEWLLTGKGEMYKDKSLRIENSSSSNTDAGDTLFSRAENPSETAVKSLELNEIESSKVCLRTICKVIVLYSDGSYSIQEW